MPSSSYILLLGHLLSSFRDKNDLVHTMVRCVCLFFEDLLQSLSEFPYILDQTSYEFGSKRQCPT